MPKIANLTKYKASWQKWWQGLQPRWRLLDDGTFRQEVPDVGEEWVGLRQGGRGGFFVIVMAFSWLVEATDDGGIDVGLLKVLDDITWVLRCMAETVEMPALPDQSLGRKRALENRSDTPVKKR